LPMGNNFLGDLSYLPKEAKRPQPLNCSGKFSIS
jgi:hypothetical protein